MKAWLKIHASILLVGVRVRKPKSYKDSSATTRTVGRGRDLCQQGFGSLPHARWILNSKKGFKPEALPVAD
jgi:hypothetical protein